MTIFINGKQKRVKRPPTIDGLPVDEFISRNADPIWLLQHEMYEELHQWELEEQKLRGEPTCDFGQDDNLDVEEDDQLPF